MDDGIERKRKLTQLTSQRNTLDTSFLFRDSALGAVVADEVEQTGTVSFKLTALV